MDNTGDKLFKKSSKNELSVQMRVFILGSVFALFCLTLLLFLTRAPSKSAARWVMVVARSIVVLAWVTLIAGIVYFMLAFSLTGNAKDNVLFEQESPDRRFVVSAFNRVGGATVNNTTVVSVRKNSEKQDTKRNSILFRLDGIKEVRAIWDNNRHITITFSSGAVYEQITNWNGITITYVRK